MRITKSQLQQLILEVYTEIHKDYGFTNDQKAAIDKLVERHGYEELPGDFLAELAEIVHGESFYYDSMLEG